MEVHTMKIADVMTRNVASVSKDASIREAAELMLAKNVSAVPVVDEERRVVGIVSEADLMRRAEIGTERQWSVWRRFAADPERSASEYLKTYGRRVEDVMTSPVVSVSEATALPDLVRVLERHKIKRVPVVRHGKLVGIVSRADLLRELVRRRADASAAAPAPASDSEIRERIRKHVRSQPWRPTWGDVFVDEGVVTLWGRERSARVRRAFAVAAENAPGVKAVHDLLYRGVYPVAAL
jgi:CBS domain-containing protein